MFTTQSIQCVAIVVSLAAAYALWRPIMSSIIVLLATMAFWMMWHPKQSQQPSTIFHKSPRKKPLNFQAFEPHHEYYRPEEAKMAERVSEVPSVSFMPQQSQVFENQTRRPVDTLDDKKARLRQFYQQDKPEPIQYAPRSQAFDESKSIHSYGNSLLGSSNIIKSGTVRKNESGQRFKQTEQVLRKLVPKLGDAQRKSEELFFKRYLQIYLDEFKTHLTAANTMMRQHFNKKIFEIEFFYQNTPNDFNSNNSEAAANKDIISIDEVIYINDKFHARSNCPWVPVSLEKFERDKSKFMSSCDLLCLCYNILHVESNGTTFGKESRRYILDRLIDINEGGKLQTNKDNLHHKVPTDYQILTSLFINGIQLSVQFEQRLKYHSDIRLSQQNQMDIFKYIEVNIISKEMFGLKQLRSDQENQTRNVFLQDVNVSNPQQEPQLHFYSDVIMRQLTKESTATALNDYILYSPQVMYCVTYYLLHLQCLPKSVQLQLSGYDYNQKFISCLMQMAQDSSYLVTL